MEEVDVHAEDVRLGLSVFSDQFRVLLIEAFGVEGALRFLFVLPADDSFDGFVFTEHAGESGAVALGVPLGPGYGREGTHEPGAGVKDSAGAFQG